jgi:hypothetical protein
VRAAVADFVKAKVDFVVELGDFKDTDASRGCTVPNQPPSSTCVNLTLGFLKDIEAELKPFQG